MIRVLAGLANDYLDLYYFPVSDSVSLNLSGIDEYHLLFQNPKEYFTNIFQTNHGNYGALLESSKSFWNDTRNNVISKMLSVFDIFSRTNFFINSLIYNFLIFFGSVALYKVFIKVFPGEKIILIASIFFLPSLIFFSSNIHRDGLIFLSFSMIIYHIFIMLNNKRFGAKSFLIILFFLFLIFLLRNFVVISLVPAIIAWIIAERNPKFVFITFCSIYILAISLFFATTLLPSSWNLPAHVASRQSDFIAIAKIGNSAIIVKPLSPQIKSFLSNLPQALNHSLMRPYITEHQSFLYVPSSMEIFFYEILFLLFIFFRKSNTKPHTLIYLSVFFACTNFIIIGYTIPILGAIVRYRSIYFPLIIIPILCLTDWRKMRKILHI